MRKRLILKENRPGPAIGEMRQAKTLAPQGWCPSLKKSGHSIPGLLELKSRFPELTTAEVRLFTLTKLGFVHQEINEMLGISLESVYRNRLAKKLGLAQTQELDNFVQAFFAEGK